MSDIGSPQHIGSGIKQVGGWRIDRGVPEMKDQHPMLYAPITRAELTVFWFYHGGIFTHFPYRTRRGA